MSYVYIIAPEADRRPCKIGISEDPWKRLPSLQSGSPIRLDVIEIFGCESRDEAFRLERDFHQSHAEIRLEGEWFDIDADDANYWLFCKNVVVDAAA